MSHGSGVQAEMAVATASAASAPELLCICDFPPGEFNGGAILLARQLADYPCDKLTIVCGTNYLRRVPAEKRWPARYIAFPATNSTGRWGLGHLKQLWEWLSLAILACKCAGMLRGRRPSAVLSVVHDRYFLAAALAAKWAGAPMVLIAHDDWELTANNFAWVPRKVSHQMLRWALRRADYILAVGPGMQQMLRERYGVESAVQLPGTEPITGISGDYPRPRMKPVHIAYAGSHIDTLQYVIPFVSREPDRYHLDVYCKVDMLNVRARGWDFAGVTFHGWKEPEAVRRALLEADILFLPYPFAPEYATFVTVGFAAKSADYLAAGRPIVVCGPEYSSIVRYAREHGFAEVVARPDAEEVRRSVDRIVEDPEHAQRLLAVSRELFARNHDIRRQRQEFRGRLRALCDNWHTAVRV